MLKPKEHKQSSSKWVSNQFFIKVKIIESQTSMQGGEKGKFNTPKEKYYRKQHEQWMENIISDSNGLSVLTGNSPAL
jgi:hypothetical protein